MAPNLVATQTPESSQRVLLHPLVLLTASDLITRHRLRQLEDPVAGILLGQQEGAQLTAEHAFTAKIKDGLFDQTDDWTTKRIQQYKEVHQKPVLEVVGWFTLCPQDGPLPEHAILHKQLTSLYAENGIMLAIHPTQFTATDGAKGKLPISVYESVQDTEPVSNEGAMQVDGKEAAATQFRPVPYVIETDETEMIAINYVAKGAGSAVAVAEARPADIAEAKKPEEASSSGPITRAAAEQKEPKTAKESVPEKLRTLTTEEEDQIAGMTTRLNSIKMLQERLQLISKSIESIPPCYLSDQTVPLSPTSPPPEQTAQLRNIQALLTRLSLLTPTGQNESEAYQQASQAQSNDVALTSLLSLLGQDIQGLSELGRKFLTVEQIKSGKGKGKGGLGGSSFGGLDEHDTRMAGVSINSLLA